MKPFNGKSKRVKSKHCVNILGVDDEPICQMMLLDVISQIAKSSLVVPSGYDAMEEIKRNFVIYHIVITDLNMPNMDGYKLCKAIKEFDSNIIVLAHTASTKSVIEDKCNDAGFDGIIIKPVDTDKLKEIINERIDNWMIQRIANAYTGSKSRGKHQSL